MEHNIQDYYKQGAECKNLVHIPPDNPRSHHRKKPLPIPTTINIIHTPASLREAMSKSFNDKLTNELSVTFSDKWLIPYNTTYIQMRLKEFMDRWTKTANYILVQDYSSTGRLHYHGLIEMVNVDKYQKLLVNLRRTFGKIECLPINKWDIYMHYITGVYEEEHEKYMKPVTWNTTRYITNKLL